MQAVHAAEQKSVIDVGAQFDRLRYHSGFGNQFESEALPGALPVGRNNPRVCPYGLYAEQLTGSAFTAPRKDNLRSWLYRIKPSVTHRPFTPCTGKDANDKIISDFNNASAVTATPNQLRWLPCPLPTRDADVDFVQGLFTVCGTGSAATKTGFAIHMFVASASMGRKALANADGDFLIVPQQGRLWVTTEFGRLQVQPSEILVLPQGVRFSIALPDGPSRGYVCEVFGGHFQLPDLGPIGANGLANPRDFQAPVAWFETQEMTSYEEPFAAYDLATHLTTENLGGQRSISEVNGSATTRAHLSTEGGEAASEVDGSREPGYVVVHKFDGRLFEAEQNFSPFNVVAWHGNYTPCKYDLRRFCPMNAVSFDHPDPSIFTVLTCPTAHPGVAVVDFVLFPPRWTVAEGTFRPPYFHRNVMSEFMGLICGCYDAKAEGFLPGGASLHSCMSPHGPDTATFERAVSEENESKPQRLPDDSLAFMFESCFTPRVSTAMLKVPYLDANYYKCWQGLRSHFSPTTKRA